MIYAKFTRSSDLDIDRLRGRMTECTTGRALWVPFMQGVLARIVGGEFEVGELIPTELQLQEQYGVSRTVIREGMKILEAKGVISITRGRGTAVQPSELWHTYDADVLAAQLEHGNRDAVLKEVLRLRICIEPEMAAQAARRADHHLRRGVQDRFVLLEAAVDSPEAYLVEDAAFHTAIAQASGFRLGSELLATIDRAVRMQRALTQRIPGGAQVAHPQHRAIHEAILADEPAAAAEAMRAHLTWAAERLDSLLAVTDHRTAR